MWCAVCISGTSSRIRIPHWPPVHDFSPRILRRIGRCSSSSKPTCALSLHVLSLNVLCHLTASFGCPRTRHLAKVWHFWTPYSRLFLICRSAPRYAHIGWLMTFGTLGILMSMGRMISWGSFDSNVIQMSWVWLLSTWRSLTGGLLMLVLLEWHILLGRRRVCLVGLRMLEIQNLRPFVRLEELLLFRALFIALS